MRLCSADVGILGADRRPTAARTVLRLRTEFQLRTKVGLTCSCVILRKPWSFLHKFATHCVLIDQLLPCAEFRVDSVKFCLRLQELRSKLQPGKDPAKPVIFLVRMVIECLSKGETTAV
jgi:hypothetical protein